ncbi:MAG: phosphoribosylformylglycinamidine synthase subunit PurS [Terriglobia bacterium]
MKAEVIVSLKKTVLDPQGKAIHHAIESLGFKSVAEVRQGKLFEIYLDGIQDEAAAREEIERIAREVLTNPVIEEFSCVIKKEDREGPR